MYGQYNAIEQFIWNWRPKRAVSQEGLIDRGQLFTEENAIVVDAAQSPVNGDA